MSGGSWENVRASGATFEVPAAKGLLESKKY